MTLKRKQGKEKNRKEKQTREQKGKENQRKIKYKETGKATEKRKGANTTT